MDKFKYVNDMTSLLKIDGPMTAGPIPRWQKKGSAENSLINASTTSMNRSKTPSKQGGLRRQTSETPSKSKTPRTKAATPAKGSKTPCGGDRFIPSRSATNFDLGHFKLKQDENEESPTKQELQKIMSENLHGKDISKQRILAFQKKPSSAPEGFQNPMRVLYSQIATPASAKNSNRYVPQGPDRILDAPDIVNDYYLNLVDWSSNNILAAALGANVYLWNAATGKTELLLELEGNDYICSVAWIQEGDFLAIGTTSGTTELWDCNKARRVRAMEGHSARVGSLAWNNYVVSSGSRSGQIINHDVRNREHLVNTISAHTQEVCGLKWSTDGKHLASGGNDNVLNIYTCENGAYNSTTTPLYNITAHQAAVKALAWCPWQPYILASGGGTADRNIRFWNTNNGSCINSVDTKSQVCALLWSTNYKEIISGHGFAHNQLIIWKYPGMSRVAELIGHTARVLHLAMSPDGSTVLSAGADETLRLWKCFVKNPTKAKEPTQVKTQYSALKQCIR